MVIVRGSDFIILLSLAALNQSSSFCGVVIGGPVLLHYGEWYIDDSRTVSS